MDCGYAVFGEDVSFEGATFHAIRQLGPITVLGLVNMSDVEFRSRVKLQIASYRLVLDRAQFRAGGELLASGADISLVEATVAEPMIISVLMTIWINTSLRSKGGGSTPPEASHTRSSLENLFHASVYSSAPS